LTIQRNWRHRAHKRMASETNTQYNTCWTPLCTSKHK